MNNEDDEFNRIEREADMRRKAVSAAINEHVMHMRAHLSEYERGVIDGRQMQMRSSVDKAVNAMSKREWIELTEEAIETLIHRFGGDPHTLLDEVNARLKEKNT
jgi:hypothetical protein